MDQRELESRVKALMKSVSANEPAENAIKLLEGLKKEAHPTEEMLRTDNLHKISRFNRLLRRNEDSPTNFLPKATRAGVFVGKLRSNTNKDIARAATELVSKWKKLVEAEKANKGGKSKTGSPAPTASPQPAAASTPSNSKKPFKGDPEQRKYQSDHVDIRRTDSETRNNCIGLLYNGLAYRSTEPVEDVLAKAVAVESAAFTSLGGETPDYKKKIRSLFTNLKNKSNRALGPSVLGGRISPDRFVTMTDEELKSDEQRKKETELEKENMKNAQVPQEERSVSDSLECGKCKKKQVSYSQAQTRSADEPMTTFCICVNCGNRWKFS